MIHRKGQALILLLIFILVAITIATTSVSILISNAQGTSSAVQNNEAYYAAQAGIENAFLRLLRDKNYSGETMQISSTSSVQITITRNGNYEVLSVGSSGQFTRKIQATLNYTDTVLSIISWQELYQ